MPKKNYLDKQAVSQLQLQFFRGCIRFGRYIPIMLSYVAVRTHQDFVFDILPLKFYAVDGGSQRLWYIKVYPTQRCPNLSCRLPSLS